MSVPLLPVLSYQEGREHTLMQRFCSQVIQVHIQSLQMAYLYKGLYQSGRYRIVAKNHWLADGMKATDSECDDRMLAINP